MALADILVIEDNLELSAVIRDFLEAEGYSVASVSSAEEGLELLNSKAVKLLLLDIMLPGIDGFAVCRLARETYNLPILIMSARHGMTTRSSGWSWERTTIWKSRLPFSC